MNTGKKLIELVKQTDIPSGQLGIWWIGQHGFILKINHKTIYIDPFLSDHAKRLTPPLLKPEEITNADYILGTHDHRDHIDREMWPAIAKASPQAIFIVPEFHRAELCRSLQIPEKRMIGMNDGETKQLDNLTISAIAAAHEFLDQDPTTGLYPFLGYILESKSITIYHSGDCCPYDGLTRKLQKWQIDIALLPINGRDAERFRKQYWGNMTFQETVDLTGAIKPQLTIPTHFDMMPGNLEDPKNFIEYLKLKFPEQTAKTPRYGETIIYP